MCMMNIKNACDIYSSTARRNDQNRKDGSMDNVGIFVEFISEAEEAVVFGNTYGTNSVKTN